MKCDNRKDLSSVKSLIFSEALHQTNRWADSLWVTRGHIYVKATSPQDTATAFSEMNHAVQNVADTDLVEQYCGDTITIYCSGSGLKDYEYRILFRGKEMLLAEVVGGIKYRIALMVGPNSVFEKDGLRLPPIDFSKH